MPFPIIPAIATGISALGLLGGSDTDKQQAELSQVNRALAGEAKESSQLGSDVLGPAAEYLKALAGGDRQEMLQATMPERRRVIDQYDSAKKAISEFAPRGGSQASSLIQLEANKASDLAMVGAGARRQAVGDAANLGTALKSTALGARGQQQAGIGSQINTILAEAQQRGLSMAAVGEALGTLFGDYYYNRNNPEQGMGEILPALGAAAGY